MIRDRGIIKWNSLMLPEHVTMLRDWTKEDTYKKSKQLDEQKLELLNETAQMAIESGVEVTIDYFSDHEYEKVTGKIDSFDIVKKAFRIRDSVGDVRWIPTENINQIELE